MISEKLILLKGIVLVDHDAIPTDYELNQVVEYEGIEYIIYRIEGSILPMSTPRFKEGVGLIVKLK